MSVICLQVIARRRLPVANPEVAEDVGSGVGLEVVIALDLALNLVLAPGLDLAAGFALAVDFGLVVGFGFGMAVEGFSVLARTAICCGGERMA